MLMRSAGRGRGVMPWCVCARLPEATRMRAAVRVRARSSCAVSERVRRSVVSAGSRLAGGWACRQCAHRGAHARCARLPHASATGRIAAAAMRPRSWPGQPGDRRGCLRSGHARRLAGVRGGRAC